MLFLTSSKEAAAMIRITNELESIGDSSLNLFLELEKFKGEFDLNDEINNEILELINEVMKFYKWNSSFINNNIKTIIFS